MDVYDAGFESLVAAQQNDILRPRETGMPVAEAIAREPDPQHMRRPTSLADGRFQRKAPPPSSWCVDYYCIIMRRGQGWAGEHSGTTESQESGSREML